MQKFYAFTEKAIGFLIVSLLSLIFSARAMAQDRPLYIYHLDPTQFADIIRSQALLRAEDAPALKSYLQDKYGLPTLTDQDMKENLSVEDLQEYQRHMYHSTGFTTSNPTCICD